MHEIVTAGLGVLGLALVLASSALAQEGWDDVVNWSRATPAAVQERLDSGAAVNARDEHGNTPLHWAARENAPLAVMALLLDGGAAVNARDVLGYTPLHWAAGNAPLAVVALLLDRGAAVDAQDRGGNTPLHLADTPAVAALLLDRGADLTGRNYSGQTPLHTAARFNDNPAVVALLLDRGADATLRDDKNKLAFDLAKENEHLQGTDVYWRLNDARF